MESSIEMTYAGTRFRFGLTVLFLVVGYLTHPPATIAQNNDRLRARVVLIIPNGAKAPEGYKERLGSVAVLMENFIAKWMVHWGYEIERPEFFERESDGSVHVTLIKGTLDKVEGRKSIPQLHRLAVRGAKAKLGIQKNRTVTWWIFYDYPGMEGFRGGGDSLSGSAINRYPRQGRIDLQRHVLSPAKAKGQIKASMHEFGHALGLPHTGPRTSLDMGNSLMGPITPKFHRKTKSKDNRVYLTESSAALLWKHPLFRSEKPHKPVMPKSLTVSDLKATERQNGNIVVTGRLDSNLSAHSAILFDSGKSNFGGDYWARSYVAEIDDKGRFEVTVLQPFQKGKMYLSFCFDNGINTADRKKQTLRKSVIGIAYRGQKGRRQFQVGRR